MPYAKHEVYDDDKRCAEMVFRAQEKSRLAFAPLRENKWPYDFYLWSSRHDPAQVKKIARNMGDYFLEYSPHAWG